MEDAIRAGGVDVEWRGWQSQTLATVAAGSMWPVGLPTREQSAVLSPTAPACVPQDHLEPVLLEHLRSLGATRVHLGTEVVGVANGPDGVEVGLRHVASGDVRTVRARYVIAADGAHSRIRTALGIAMRGPDRLAHVVNALFRAPLWPSSASTVTASTPSSTPTAPGCSCPRAAGPVGLRNVGRRSRPRNVDGGTLRQAHPRRRRDR